MDIAAPAVNVLTRQQMDMVHSGSLNILSTAGIRVDSKRACEYFAASSCRVEGEGQVYIEKELVQWALSAAPSTIDIYNRAGEHCFTLRQGEKSQTRFGVGVTNLHYQDPITDKVTPFSSKDMEKAVLLGNSLDQFDVISTPGIARDLPPETADLFSTLTMVANSVKPLVLLVSEHGCFGAVMDMISHIHPGGSSGLREKPFVIPYFNPITPLVLNAETVEKMIMTIHGGLPFIYNNYGMSGATAPITPGGTLALLNAELLAGIVFSQLVKEGAPIIAGTLPAGFDMKNMMSVYTPHTMLLNLACAEMMDYYSIPHSGSSGSGTGWGPDLLAAGTFWMNHLTSCMGKVGLAPFVGGNFDSMAFSPAAVVYADEVIRLSRTFSRGFSVGPESIDISEIKKVGSAGNYLSALSTGKRFREFRFESNIWPIYTLEQWMDKNSPAADALLRDHCLKLLNNPVVPRDRGDLLDKGNEFISNLLHCQS